MTGFCNKCVLICKCVMNGCGNLQQFTWDKNQANSQTIFDTKAAVVPRMSEMLGDTWGNVGFKTAMFCRDKACAGVNRKNKF